MVTAEDVKTAYADCNGQEAADDVAQDCYEAAAYFARMDGIESASTVEFPYIDERVAVALDVFRTVGLGTEFRLTRTV